MIFCKVCQERTELIKDRRGNYFCSKCKCWCYDKGSNTPCEICNQILLFPHIHHIDGNPQNNSSENRLAVCSACHQAIHRGIGEGRKRYYVRRKSFKDPHIRFKIRNYTNKLFQKKYEHKH